MAKGNFIARARANIAGKRNIEAMSSIARSAWKSSWMKRRITRPTAM